MCPYVYACTSATSHVSEKESGLAARISCIYMLFLCTSSSTCDPSSMILGWKSQPKQVLIIRKPGNDDDVNNAFKELAHWLVKVLHKYRAVSVCAVYTDLMIAWIKLLYDTI